MLDRSSLFFKACQASSQSSTSSSTIVRITGKLPILLIKQIEDHFSFVGNAEKFCCVLEISDGVHKCRALLSKKYWYKTDPLLADSGKSEKRQLANIVSEKTEFLRSGSVIILSEYSIGSKNELLNEPINDQETKTCNFNPDVIIIINEFQVVGHFDEKLINNLTESPIVASTFEQNNVNFSNQLPFKPLSMHVNEQTSFYPTLEKKSSSQLKSDYKKDNVSEKPIITISSLNFKTPSKWTLNATVTKIQPIRKFDNRTNGSPGQIIRFQIRDSTGQMECVAFNQIIDSKSLKELEVNRSYQIQDCDIKISKATCRAWPFDLSSKYELVFENSSSIKIAENQQHNDLMCLISNLEKRDDALDKPGVIKTEIVKRCRPVSVSPYQSTLGSKFTLLNDLITKPTKSLQNVIAILSQLDSELKLIKGKKSGSIYLRNGRIIDKTCTEVIIALWGSEAEDCKFEIGEAIMFNDVLLTNYGGISLSVIRPTKLIKLDSSHPIGGELLHWHCNVYRQHKTKF